MHVIDKKKSSMLLGEALKEQKIIQNGSVFNSAIKYEYQLIHED